MKAAGAQVLAEVGYRLQPQQMGELQNISRGKF